MVKDWFLLLASIRLERSLSYMEIFTFPGDIRPYNLALVYVYSESNQLYCFIWTQTKYNVTGKHRR